MSWCTARASFGQDHCWISLPLGNYWPAGQYCQFLAPRHIIRLMVEMTAPRPMLASLAAAPDAETHADELLLLNYDPPLQGSLGLV